MNCSVSHCTTGTLALRLWGLVVGLPGTEHSERQGLRVGESFQN